VRERLRIWTWTDRSEQAYDIHVRPLPDYVPNTQKWEEEQAKRAKDREDWVKKSEQRQHDHRLKTFKQVAEEQIQNIQQCKTTAPMVEKMLQELYALNPEWEIRRQKAQAVGLISVFVFISLTCS
jgi:hypothetical protein